MNPHFCSASQGMPFSCPLVSPSPHNYGAASECGSALHRQWGVLGAGLGGGGEATAGGGFPRRRSVGKRRHVVGGASRSTRNRSIYTQQEQTSGSGTRAQHPAVTSASGRRLPARHRGGCATASGWSARLRPAVLPRHSKTSAPHINADEPSFHHPRRGSGGAAAAVGQRRRRVGGEGTRGAGLGAGIIYPCACALQI